MLASPHETCYRQQMCFSALQFKTCTKEGCKLAHSVDDLAVSYVDANWKTQVCMYYPNCPRALLCHNNHCEIFCKKTKDRIEMYCSYIHMEKLVPSRTWWVKDDFLEKRRWDTTVEALQKLFNFQHLMNSHIFALFPVQYPETSKNALLLHQQLLLNPYEFEHHFNLAKEFHKAWQKTKLPGNWNALCFELLCCMNSADKKKPRKERRRLYGQIRAADMPCSRAAVCEGVFNYLEALRHIPEAATLPPLRSFLHPRLPLPEFHSC